MGIKIIKLLKYFRLWAGPALLLISLYYCSGASPKVCTTQYSYSFEGNEYRIRSVVIQEEGGSYNELLSKKFLAVDFDQDRIIDKVILGDADFQYVQTIYDYGLDLLAKEKKLEVQNIDVNGFHIDNSDYFKEIKSFYPRNARPFNQFKIINKKQIVDPEILVVTDENADGFLNKIVKGEGSLKELQILYTEMIAEGLKTGKLLKTDDMILVEKD